MKKILVNTNYSFEIEESSEEILLNGSPIQLDLKKVNDKHFHILLENKSYTAEIVKIDYKEKEATIKVNGVNHQMRLKDENEILLERMGIEINKVNHDSDLKAPMPGLILDILIKPGDQVKKGDSLLIMEAMKMENLIKSTGEFTIQTIEVKKGDKVEKNQLLLSFT